jgi:hypothetical protein
VQDALIEDYFRYDDLSRMEADDILMNISEIEDPNYQYVELDLLNLPILFEYTQEESSHNTVKVFGRYLSRCHLSSPIEVKKSVITFMSLFVIEDYFRYNDLSRMEADDILMNISEIESPNYEYVELDLLNLPRDLSTNLNEDSERKCQGI